MNRAKFEASPRREGYEVREGEIEPHQHREAHAHEFDARIFVLEVRLPRRRFRLSSIARSAARRPRSTSNSPARRAWLPWRRTHAAYRRAPAALKSLRRQRVEALAGNARLAKPEQR
jgi:hypothetical protein